MMLTNRLHPWLAAAGLATLLAACGGGGGGGEEAAGPVLVAPPTAAATLAQTDNEAMAAVQALNSSNSVLVSKSAALQGGSLFAPVGASGSPLNVRNTLAGAAREQALSRETVSCANLGLTSCSGSVTFDTNVVADNATVVPAGSYFAATFNNLSGAADGDAVSMNGLFRMDFLTALNIDALDFANARFQVTLGGLSGTVDGITFGPETALALYEFDPRGTPTLTIDGLRIQGGVSTTDAQNYSVSNGTRLRTAHWSNAAGYVDVQFTESWIVSQGRPSAGSSAIISGGNASMTIRVQSSSAGSVVYAVTATVNGATVSYTVTATYPASGAPTYTVVSTPT
jgi:hypothetical protein